MIFADYIDRLNIIILAITIICTTVCNTIIFIVDLKKQNKDNLKKYL